MKTTNKILISIAALFILQLYLASAFTIEDVSISPSVIAPGENVKVSLDIKNNFQEDFENVQVALDLSQVPFSSYLSSSQQTIDELNEDKTKEVSFDLQANSDASSGTYKIPVIITANTSKETSFISLTINSKPVISLDTDNYFIKGKNQELSLKIINSGLGNAKFLTVVVGDTPGLTITTSKNIYVGDLDSNDFTTVDFKVIASNTASSLVSIPVIISYKDFLNKDYTDSLVINVKAYTQQEAISLGLIQKSNAGIIITVIVVLIILYFIYRAIRKRLRNKKIKESV